MATARERAAALIARGEELKRRHAQANSLKSRFSNPYRYMSEMDGFEGFVSDVRIAAGTYLSSHPSSAELASAADERSFDRAMAALRAIESDGSWYGGSAGGHVVVVSSNAEWTELAVKAVESQEATATVLDASADLDSLNLAADGADAAVVIGQADFAFGLMIGRLGPGKAILVSQLDAARGVDVLRISPGWDDALARRVRDAIRSH